MNNRKKIKSPNQKFDRKIVIEDIWCGDYKIIQMCSICRNQSTEYSKFHLKKGVIDILCKKCIFHIANNDQFPKKIE